ncbi:MazG-like family protein (plasmid) [Streptomyces sp. DSM 116496]|uniref:MazG-like family protein n=1 Tax=Streptomyces stoeckheimensis TaxID=3344656 RepID=UPI0038B34487
MSRTRTSALICAVSAWIDAAPGNKDRDPEALLWGRVTKVGEESGEVIAALVGATGQNPRKGNSHTLQDVERELLDTAMTALAAVAHLHTRDAEPPDVLDLLDDHVLAVARRAQLS